MNKLSLDKKVQVIQLLVEGNSIRATSRISDVSKPAVLKLLGEVGRACQAFHNKTVVNLKSRRIQADEIWSFVGCKEKSRQKGKQGHGDAWTWTALDADTKLIVGWYVGNRNADSANEFMQDVAKRLERRVQLTTDGLHCYLEAVTEGFGSQIDFAQLVKIYGKEGSTSNAEKKYSPAECIGCKKTVISGNPDPDHISTSYVERQNLTMRMHMRRFTRLTNAFSKKIENHTYAISLHFVYYNFVKIHKTLRVPPAMEAGLIKRLMTIEDIVRLADK
jgi:IS1 family transposase